ncbi:MAG TPA: DinB family protein [Candidatus Polarisedimenticolaceae bacterium]|nr:DinB family protein [Candidatus Polarisedimenticolaceae bacterium]
MSPDPHPAGINIHYLDQGSELIENLTDELYAAGTGERSRGGVGAQLRHCLDFYDCFLAGITERAIDYNRRKRDTRAETDRSHAAERLHKVRETLLRLTADTGTRPLRVRAECGAAGAAEWSDSSVARELQFLVSHTIHHYALIAMMLRTQGYDVAREQPDFGIAPSTLAHWKEIGSFVG